MILPKLALRDLLGTGLQTWLNIFVLSLAFVVIILSMGFNQGLMEQVSNAMIRSELGRGQYWHPHYDPYDPLTLDEAHGVIPGGPRDLIAQGHATAILITQGAIYPEGRILPIRLKGIDPRQEILDIPSRFLEGEQGVIPALVGTRMAKSANLKLGDYVTLRWRDVNGTFDARDAVIKQIMNTSVQSIDSGIIWLPLQSLQEITGMRDEASLIVVDESAGGQADIEGWIFKDLDLLLKDLHDLMRTRMITRSVLYVILLFLAIIAIFNSQVLTIFRRRKEIGTLMALGMSRGKIIQLFTLEGGITGILAIMLGAVYGIPLLTYLAFTGIDVPASSDQFGLAIGRTLYPKYGLVLIVFTTAVVLLTVTIVSYLPTRRIAKLKPTEALRGKLS